MLFSKNNKKDINHIFITLLLELYKLMKIVKKIILLSIIFISNSINISKLYYPYTSRLQLIIKPTNYNPAISFMNLNKILNNNEKKNNLLINYYNNNKSIIFNYNTFSYLEDYNYSYKYLLRNKETYLIKYNFNVNDETQKYLILIKSKNISITKIKWDIYIKYNYLIINKETNDRIITKIIRGCILKNESKINPILKEYFRR